MKWNYTNDAKMTRNEWQENEKMRTGLNETNYPVDEKILVCRRKLKMQVEVKMKRRENSCCKRKSEKTMAVSIAIATT